jgi:hypothetical protein
MSLLFGGLDLLLLFWATKSLSLKSHRKSVQEVHYVVDAPLGSNELFRKTEAGTRTQLDTTQHYPCFVTVQQALSLFVWRIRFSILFADLKPANVSTQPKKIELEQVIAELVDFRKRNVYCLVIGITLGHGKFALKTFKVKLRVTCLLPLRTKRKFTFYLRSNKPEKVESNDASGDEITDTLVHHDKKTSDGRICYNWQPSQCVSSYV